MPVAPRQPEPRHLPIQAAAPRQPEPHYARESGRWGEADNVHRKMHIEKGPVDLFPAEPTDEPFIARRP